MLYIKLFHGRKHIYEQLDDWGSDGPIFGPYDHIHTTYAGFIRMAANDSEADLHVFDDVVYYGGVYYGDWTVFTTDHLSPDEQALHQEYHESKSKPPSLSPTRKPPVKIVVYVRGGVCIDVKTNLVRDDCQYQVIDYDPAADDMPSDLSRCRQVLIMSKGYELAMAARKVIDKWPTGQLAAAVNELDAIVKEVLPKISGESKAF